MGLQRMLFGKGKEEFGERKLTESGKWKKEKWGLRGSGVGER